jgi:putative sterol carrier protein
MTDATTDFFATLGSRGHEPLLKRASGRLRFEITDGKRTDRWLVAVDGGDVVVSHKGGEADVVLGGRKTLFDQLAAGKANAMAALLRGELTIEGDYNLLVLFQRLFPGPQRKRKQRQSAGYARRRS